MQNNQQKLQEEHDFTFKKTNVPQELIPLLKEIENNKRKWKSLYLAVWGLPLYFLQPEFIDKRRKFIIRYYFENPRVVLENFNALRRNHYIDARIGKFPVECVNDGRRQHNIPYIA